MNESLINSTLILCKTCAILLEKVDKGSGARDEKRLPIKPVHRVQDPMQPGLSGFTITNAMLAEESFSIVSLPVFRLRTILGIPRNAGALLTVQQAQRLATAIIRSSPGDPSASAFVGGAFREATSGKGPWRHVPYDEPLLVFAGEQGAIALLASTEGERLRCVILTDPRRVDQAAITLAQFSDDAPALPDVAMPDVQRAFVATILAAIVADPYLSQIDLAGLMPAEHRWIELAQRFRRHADLTALFGDPQFRQTLHDYGFVKALVGTLTIDQKQIRTVTAIGDGAPDVLSLTEGLVSQTLRSGRPASGAAAADTGLDAAGQRWMASHTLTAVPLLRDGAIWGLLLATSPRLPSGAARAVLVGLGTLISLTHGGVAPMSRDVAPPMPSPARPSLTGAPVTRLIQTQVRRQAALRSDLGTLFERLTDAVVLVDTQGRLVSFTPAAADALELSMEDRGRTLVETNAVFLAPLISEALMNDERLEREIDLPRGGRARVSISSIDETLWGVVIRHRAAPTPPTPTMGGDTALDRHERFLMNFARMIQAPLRELRETIVQLPEPDTMNDHQARLLGQVTRLNSEVGLLVNDLLALSQLRLQVSREYLRVNLATLIEAAVSTHYAVCASRGQSILIDLPPDPPFVFGSPTGLGRALDILLDNASKYSPDGATIRVAAFAEAGHVMVTVEDTGYGLSESEMAEVFEPFYRASSAERSGMPGRGLGLTTARAIIEQHGGQIWVSSQPDRGSTFAFRLPSDEHSGSER